MNRLLVIAVVLTLSVVAEPSDKAWQIIPGKRVGPVTGLSSQSTLEALFGRKNVTMSKLPAAEGETIDGARIHAGPERQLEVIWEEMAVGKRISMVRLIGKGWTLDNGLRLGLTVADVEKINGKPFKVSGFDWDYGGWANFSEGALATGVSVRFSPTESDYSREIVGDRDVSSASTALRAANPLVTEIDIHLGQ
jgi:hypothetical protein